MSRLSNSFSSLKRRSFHIDVLKKIWMKRSSPLKGGAKRKGECKERWRRGEKGLGGNEIFNLSMLTCIVWQSVVFFIFFCKGSVDHAPNHNNGYREMKRLQN